MQETKLGEIKEDFIEKEMMKEYFKGKRVWQKEITVCLSKENEL